MEHIIKGHILEKDGKQFIINNGYIHKEHLYIPKDYTIV